jgi:hypothetical protein
VLHLNDATLSGVVRDGSTGAGVPHALIILGNTNPNDAAQAAWTDTYGAYIGTVSGIYPVAMVVQLTTGPYSVRHRAIKPFTIPAGASSQDFVLASLTVAGSPCSTDPLTTSY